MYITQKEKNEELHMINKMFSYSRRGIPLKGEEGREGGCDCVCVGGGERRGEDGIRTVENGARKREKGRERVERKWREKRRGGR